MHIGKKGFTLVEIIVSLAIMSIVAGAVGAFVIAGNNSYMRGNKELTLQEEAQLSANQLIDLIIDVERGISFRTTTGQAVDEAGNPVADNVPVSELLLRNNDNVYMVRWQGQTAGAEYASANQLYLYEAANTKDADGKITAWGDPSDPSQATPSLMAEYVTAFNIDLTDLEKRKVKLEMTFVYQDKSYNVSETIKLRNDLSDEESDGYVWIDGLSIAPNPADVARGASQTFTYKFSGDSAAVKAATAQGVSWSVSKADGSACGSTIDSDGKLSVALDEQLGDGVLSVTCTSKADTSKVATALVNVRTNVHYSISISPTAENIMQGQHKTFTCTVTKTENGKTEEVTGMAVDWDVAASVGTKDADTKIVNGLLTVGRNQKEGTRVLQVTCMLSNDKSIKDTAMVNVLPYSKIDGKYDAKLIADTLNPEEYTENGEKKVEYRGIIECLPSWADYTHNYPKITWSVLEDPDGKKFQIYGNEGEDKSQYTATLRCGNQTKANYPDGINVQAIVKLTDTIEITLTINITLPDLKAAVVADAPYIASKQMVLNRNGNITCEIENYDDEVNWRFEEVPAELKDDFDYNGKIQKAYMVGFNIFHGAYEEGKREESYLTTESTGKSTDIRALSFIPWDKEYRLNLQAWSLDNSTLIAETVILVPEAEVRFAGNRHTITVQRPSWTNIYDVEVYGFESRKENGHRNVELAAEFEGEKAVDPETHINLFDNKKLPFSQVQFNIGAHEQNEILIMRVYDERYPDRKRNLMLIVEKKPDWWEWKQ